MTMKTPEATELANDIDDNIGRADITNGGTYDIWIVNRSGAARTVSVTQDAANNTLTAGQYLCYQLNLPATGEPIILKGVPLSAGRYVNARASGIDVDANMLGVDKD